jgi:hypothetical protein
MLKDRRVLLEHDLIKAHEEAAELYLKIVTQGGDVDSVEYQTLKEKVANIQFDLNMVNNLIKKGHA